MFAHFPYVVELPKQGINSLTCCLFVHIKSYFEARVLLLSDCIYDYPSSMFVNHMDRRRRIGE
jgi:hypothetical protein